MKVSLFANLLKFVQSSMGQLLLLDRMKSYSGPLSRRISLHIHFHCSNSAIVKDLMLNTNQSACFCPFPVITAFF